MADETERLIADFNRDMWQILDREHEIGLCSTRFRGMLELYGGVDTAHRLLKSNPEPMFKYLRDRHREDLCMEYYVALDKYKALFAEQERNAAEWRVREAP